MSASLNPRSNGLAEATVKRLIEHLKLYATDDLSIEAKLPLIELRMRVTSHSRLELSPFEVVFGRQPGERSRRTRSHSAFFRRQGDLL